MLDAQPDGEHCTFTAAPADFAQEHGIAYKPTEVLVSCGGKHALYNVFQALIEAGDEVVIFTPYWVSYADMVRVAGGVPVLVETTMETGSTRKVCVFGSSPLVGSSNSSTSGFIVRTEPMATRFFSPPESM